MISAIVDITNPTGLALVALGEKDFRPIAPKHQNVTPLRP